MIRALIFDCFGVLYHGSLGALYEHTSPEHHQELRDLSHSSDYGYVSRDEYVQRVSELTGSTTDEISALLKAQHIRSQSMVSLARTLGRDYKIALLSNVGRDTMNRLFTPKELDELFDTVVLSSDVGMVKPYAQIYELTARRLNVKPEECIMIDDSADNVSGAELVGMKGVLCTSTQQATEGIWHLLGDTHA